VGVYVHLLGYASYMVQQESITPIGITNYRNSNKLFGIKDADRFQHIYVIGKTGTGKSTLLKRMALEDIIRGNSVAIIDPHGDISKDLLEKVPEARKSDIVIFNPLDPNTTTYNPLAGVSSSYHSLVASGLISSLRNIWSDSWGPRTEYILRFSILSLLWFPTATLLDIQKLLTQKEFRNSVLAFVGDEHILSFWKNEFEKYSPQLRNEVISPILNKIGLFASVTPLRHIFGDGKNNIKLQQVMDGGKVFIANLAKGRIGEDACSLLGSMLVSGFQLAAIHRAKLPEHQRKPFYLYIDECHSFITLSFADILSEARKYKLSLFLTHQYIGQLQEPIRAAIFGNIGTLICFRIGADDAAFLRNEFAPVFDEHDLINLPRHSIYLKLMIDGMTSIPFSAVTHPLYNKNVDTV